ncbi:MAG TPA: FmdB family zinc ribbon protein, partial [Gaiellales bacterium]|nr:FmdB family zinc ribbon protein [Gaiellales bacterium]
NGHTFDVLQKFADEPLDECEVCGAPSRRVLHPVAIHFKGSGFYTTDSGRGKKKASEGAGDPSSKGDSSSTSDSSSKSDSSSSSKDSKPSGDSGSSAKKAAEA